MRFVHTPKSHMIVRLREAGILRFAHRGGSGAFPENTLLAFRSALELGVNCIETDVHLSRDGHLVCFHDDLLDRTTNATGPLRNLNLAELRQLDAAHHFQEADGVYAHRGTGLKVPTFAELCDLPGDFVINIDMKSPEPELPGKLLEAIMTRGLQDRVIVASEEYSRLAKFRRLVKKRCGEDSTVLTSASSREAYLALTFSKLRIPWPVPYCALQLPPVSGRLEVVTRRLVDWAHSAGVQVHVWTIDEPDEMRRLAELGIDGLMTDEPQLLCETLRD